MEPAVYVGDWNIALDPTLDTLNYQDIRNPRARLQLLDKMAEFGLIDIFRELNPTSKKYSWKQWGSHKFSRLDYFLVSNSLTPFVQKVDFLTKCYSGDHCPILLDLDFSKFKRGRGFWKMNNSLLYDSEYVDVVKDAIKEVTAQYAIIEHVEELDIHNFFNDQTPESLQTLQLKINPELFFNCLTQLRGRENV